MIDLEPAPAREPSARAGLSVALVTMPFLATDAPSIQLGLLKAIAAERGFDAHSFHLNLDFAAQIGYAPYNALCACGPNHLGEWLFSHEAFGPDAPDRNDELLQRLDPDHAGELHKHGLTLERLSELRHVEARSYIDGLIDSVPWGDFQVVGFTSSFEQNTASFALARRLKQRFPELLTVFGGANFDGDMGIEWVRAVDCIDYAVVGEGDQAFPEFLEAVRSGGDPARVAGVICRRDGVVAAPTQRPLANRMDQSPIPDYREFFTRIDRLGFLPDAARRRLRLPFESARGCWWGAKHHCTFCGLNGSSMSFRSKTPERVATELAEQARRHGHFEFYAVDNILDMSYLKDFFSRLAADGCDYEFFYEVKSNLTRAQVRQLQQGGVRRIQPGIESLSTPVLKLMRKGVTAIQNVNLLRWARYYDMYVDWNLLYGFPGETVENYREQADLLQLLRHLEPPNAPATRIAMQRFSPIHSDRKSFPAIYVRPDANYQHIYPERVDLERAVYYFDYELAHTLPESALAESRDVVLDWIESWRGPRRPRMQFRHAPGFIEIEDRRNPAKPRAYSVEGSRAALYAACSDEAHSAAALQRLLQLDWSVADIEAALYEFQSLGLMMREDQRFLSLALPASPNR
jgi:ribosomal peptide maturation radical SAM protein 1